MALLNVWFLDEQNTQKLLKLKVPWWDAIGLCQVLVRLQLILLAHTLDSAVQVARPKPRNDWHHLQCYRCCICCICRTFSVVHLTFFWAWEKVWKGAAWGDDMLCETLSKIRWVVTELRALSHRQDEAADLGGHSELGEELHVDERRCETDSGLADLYLMAMLVGLISAMALKIYAVWGDLEMERSARFAKIDLEVGKMGQGVHAMAATNYTWII